MGFLRRLLHYLSAPVFFVMAGVTWLLHQHASAAMASQMGAQMGAMDMAGMAMPDNGASVLGIHLSAGTVDGLGSWWLMYLLMGIFAAGPWLDLGKSSKQ